jgi:signal peptidase II
MIRRLAPKARLFWPLALTVLCADCATKRAVVEHLEAGPRSQEVVGDFIRFTLAYNPGAAMGLPIGEGPRWVLVVLAFGVLAMLAVFYRRAAPDDWRIGAALALLIGGALGNLIDRLRSERGVVDFIDVGIGDLRFYVFNIADIGVMTGAAILAVLLWRRDAAGETPREPRVGPVEQ